MKFIGLLMTACDEDVRDEVAAASLASPDYVYVLDGSGDEPFGDRYWRDSDLPESYGTTPRDGWREWLYRRAVEDHGHDNWFLLLHSDEVWTVDPRHVVAEWPSADGVVFRLPLHIPREEWRDGEPVLEQLRWNLAPGYPELRMFRGGDGVGYDVFQHFDVTPRGVGRIARTEYVIKHYPYRSPASQERKAQLHAATGFDPDNYQPHLLGTWTDEMIASYQRQSVWRELRRD